MEAQQTFNEEDFSIPQRQSPAAIFILVLRSAIAVFKSLWPALLVVMFNTKKQSETPKVLIMVVVLGVLAIVFALLRYFFYHFHIQAGNLIINTGWLKKKTLSIPLKSIQAVHLEQNIWQQVFNVSKVTFDSAGSEKVEAKMDALTMGKAEQLKQLLLAHVDDKPKETVEATETVSTVYRLGAPDLIKLSLSANHLEAFFILLFLGLNLLEDLKKAFAFDGWQWMEKTGVAFEKNIFLVVTVLILFAAVISILFSAFRTIVRYFDFSLFTEHQKWKITFGLLNRQQRIIPHNKIQVYSWHANWLRRKINFWMLDIKTVGQKVRREKQMLKIPLTSMEAATSLAVSYQQSEVAVPTKGDKIEPAHWQRTTLLISIPTTLALVGFGWFWLGWQSLWIGLSLCYFVFRNIRWYQNFRWYANQEGLQVYKGVWGRRYSLLRWNKVQKITLSQSPYQRSHQLASVKFITAGGAVSVPYIKLETARELVDTALFLLESNDEKWM